MYCWFSTSVRGFSARRSPPRPSRYWSSSKRRKRPIFSRPYSFSITISAVYVGRDLLVPPPLVRDLVRRHEERVVDVVAPHVGDEADRLAVGDGVVEALREGGVARELEDAELAVLVRPELAGAVLQRRLR